MKAIKITATYSHRERTNAGAYVHPWSTTRTIKVTEVKDVPEMTLAGEKAHIRLFNQDFGIHLLSETEAKRLRDFLNEVLED